MATGRRGGTQKLADILSTVLQKRGYARPLAAAEVLAAWAHVAGERLAARTRVANFRAGILTIEVDSAAQRYEMEAFRGPELLAGLQRDESIPRVRKIVFQMGSGAP